MSPRLLVPLVIIHRVNRFGLVIREIDISGLPVATPDFQLVNILVAVHESVIVDVDTEPGRPERCIFPVASKF